MSQVITKTTVKATNDYNQHNGIKAGQILKAEKVETSYAEQRLDRYGYAHGTRVWVGISWNVNGTNYQEEDFEEVTNE